MHLVQVFVEEVGVERSFPPPNRNLRRQSEAPDFRFNLRVERASPVEILTCAYQIAAIFVG